MFCFFVADFRRRFAATPEVLPRHAVLSRFMSLAVALR